ncbi:M15 family metallopeptidase [Glutamicibacter nicotianae]|uniref:M15 family metallopeptidase n=1 Tax=Glutamicibacter nicotianae TaxID=37929 RepID=UPI00167FAD88|nr:M15 family metallopeptidase [Glutamicibacter nicotianae]
MALTRLGWDVLEPSSNRLKSLPWITGKVRSGDAYTILNELGRRFNNEVEKIRKDWSWGYAKRPVRGASVASEHSAGTAVDFNAPAHGLGLSGTFSGAQVKAIRRILADFDGAVRWGGDYAGRKDEMHFELQGGVKKLAAVAAKINGGTITPVASKPKPKPKPTKDKSGAWPEKPLKVTDKHTVQSDAAWRELMKAIGYKDKDLGLALQKWLSKLEDPRTGRGYYDTKRFKLDGDFSNESIKALQRKLYDTKGEDGKRLYNGKADGKRQAMTVNAEIGYLNLKANRGVK